MDNQNANGEQPGYGYQQNYTGQQVYPTSPQPGAYGQPYYTQPNPQGIPQVIGPDPRFDYTPISMWGYFGYSLLFGIPIVGFILILVFSFGAGRNINLRNYARSYFCMSILVICLAIFSILILLPIWGNFTRSLF